eukprot:16472_1
MATSFDYLSILVDGYIPKHLFIPIELFNLISQYIYEYGLEFNRYFVSCRTLSFYQFYNILMHRSLECLTVHLNYILHDNNPQKIDLNKSKVSNLYAMECHTLPLNLQHLIGEHLGTKVPNNASMFLAVSDNEYILLNAYLPYIKTVFTYTLPAAPASDVQPLYDKTDNVLYVTNADQNRIHSLALTDNTGNEPKWNELTNKLKYQRYRPSACMIDNDRFIGIVGGESPLRGIPLKKFEIFSKNANASIALKESTLHHDHDSTSLYHEMFHKVICGCGKSGGIEWYDINKDEWTVLCAPLTSAVSMWKSPVNPNVLYFRTAPRSYLTGDITRISRMDLRQHHALEIVWLGPRGKDKDKCGAKSLISLL